MSDVSLPTVGQEPWGEDLNAYLAMMAAEIDVNTGKISTNTGKISTNTALIAALQAEVARLSRRLTVVGRWQTNTQVGASPGGMQVTSDTGNFRQATWLRFAKFDQTSTEMTEMLAKATHLVVQHQNDSTMWVHETVTGPVVVESGYIQVPVHCDSYGKVGVAWQNVIVTMTVILD